ncbi:MAG TPA: glycosyltransferase family 4 protein [Opitutaceae bacterium]|nr:glycosyltransferase family 4 protein [Opitutaceae bacterium]
MSPAADHPRIVFANRVYWPDEQATAQLLTDLAEGLAARGWPVTVLTGRGAGLPPRELRQGVEIVRVGGRQGRHPSLLAKATAYLAFSWALRRALRPALRAGDILVAMTDPPTLAPLAASAARKAGARLVHWIQDIHPEIGLALRPNRLLAAASAPWRRRRDAAWRQADACVALGRDMAGYVASRGVPGTRVRVLPNWAPGGAAPVAGDAGGPALRREWGLGDQFVVGYSGNLGRVHALEPVLAAAAELRSEAGVAFLFVGTGSQRPALERGACRQQLAHVHFRPPQPRARLADSLAASDVQLVTLRSGCERFVFPSKLYGVLAAGRPVVFVGPAHCELAEMVRRRGAGVVAADDDAAAVTAAIRSLHADPARRAAMGRAAAGWFRATGGLPAALTAWEELLHGR